MILLWMACTPPDDTDDTDLLEVPLDPRVIGDGTAHVGDLSLDYELIALTREDGRPTYVQWVHPLEPGVSSVVLQTQPYDGITWTDDPVDAAFAAATPRDDGLYADSACDDDNDRGIAYAPIDADIAAQSTVVHLLNGHGALLVYGRYYACDDVNGEVADMRAALSFLTTRPDEIDPSRVGVFGNSWGGFLALYGAVREPAGVDVSVVVPINPPASLARLLSGVEGLSGVFPDDKLAFFDSYRHRIEAGTGGDLSDWDNDSLCAGLAGKKTLLLHDTWDTLVPFDSSASLVDGCPGVDGLWWRRPLPIDYGAVGLDHGLLGREGGYPSVYTMSSSYLYSALNDADHPALTMASRGGLRAFLRLVHDDQAVGGDVEPARARVLEAAAAGAQLYLVEEALFTPADGEWVAAVNEVWGTDLDPAGLRAALAVGFPAP